MAFSGVPDASAAVPGQSTTQSAQDSTSIAPSTTTALVLHPNRDLGAPAVMSPGDVLHHNGGTSVTVAAHGPLPPVSSALSVRNAQALAARILLLVRGCANRASSFAHQTMELGPAVMHFNGSAPEGQAIVATAQGRIEATFWPRADEHGLPVVRQFTFTPPEAESPFAFVAGNGSLPQETDRARTTAWLCSRIPEAARHAYSLVDGMQLVTHPPLHLAAFGSDVLANITVPGRGSIQVTFLRAGPQHLGLRQFTYMTQDAVSLALQASTAAAQAIPAADPQLDSNRVLELPEETRGNETDPEDTTWLNDLTFLGDPVDGQEQHDQAPELPQGAEQRTP
jgi:hypothetical protein